MRRSAPIVIAALLAPLIGRAQEEVPLRTTVDVRGVQVEGLTQRASHTHGGAPAIAPPPRLALRARRAASVRFVRAQLLRRHCREARWNVVQDAAVVEWTRGEGSGTPAATPLRLRAGEEVEVLLGVPHEHVYQACDYFAYRVHVEVDGRRASVESRLEIVRREPLPP